MNIDFTNLTDREKLIYNQAIINASNFFGDKYLLTEKTCHCEVCTEMYDKNQHLVNLKSSGLLK